MLRGAPWREQPEFEPRPISGTTVVLCPGLLGALMPMMAFATTAPLRERAFGVGIIVADSHPAATCAANAATSSAPSRVASGSRPMGRSCGPGRSRPATCC
jgi:hypothetical protein